ncbi:MAG: DEAD/DEAH box helicase, partial [Oscillospiraceae bacterium]
YVHRIGRTGRAGKTGKAITLCSGRRQVFTMRDIGRMVKSEVKPLDIPTLNDIQVKSTASNTEIVEKALGNEPAEIYTKMVTDLLEKGHDINKIAAMALELNFGKQDAEIVEIKSKSKSFTRDTDGQFRKIVISIGRDSRVAPNHIVGAITELTALNGSDIGKIEIYDNRSIVAVPSARLEEVVDAMVGCKICGRPTTTMPMLDQNDGGGRSGGGTYRGKPSYGKNSRGKSGGYDRRRSPAKKEY